MTQTSIDPLLAYTNDLTTHARLGLLSRHREYSAEGARAIEILSRRRRSNPALLDVDDLERWPAVQETVAALAEDNISPELRGHTILALDYEALMTGVDAAALVQE